MLDEAVAGCLSAKACTAVINIGTESEARYMTKSNAQNIVQMLPCCTSSCSMVPMVVLPMTSQKFEQQHVNPHVACNHMHGLICTRFACSRTQLHARTWSLSQHMDDTVYLTQAGTVFADQQRMGHLSPGQGLSQAVSPALLCL